MSLGLSFVWVPSGLAGFAASWGEGSSFSNVAAGRDTAVALEGTQEVRVVIEARPLCYLCETHARMLDEELAGLLDLDILDIVDRGVSRHCCHLAVELTRAHAECLR